MRKNLAIILLIAGGLLAVFFLTYYMHRTNREKVFSQFNENQLHVSQQTAIQIGSYQPALGFGKYAICPQ